MNVWWPHISPGGEYVACGNKASLVGRLGQQTMASWQTLEVGTGSGGHWVSPTLLWYYRDTGEVLAFDVAQPSVAPLYLFTLQPGLATQFAAFRAVQVDSGARLVTLHPSSNDARNAPSTFHGIKAHLSDRYLVSVRDDERTIEVRSASTAVLVHTFMSPVVGIGDLIVLGEWVIYGGHRHPYRMHRIYVNSVFLDPIASVNPFTPDGSGEGGLCGVLVGQMPWIATGYGDPASGRSYIGVRIAGETSGYWAERSGNHFDLGRDAKDLLLLSAPTDGDFTIDRWSLANMPAEIYLTDRTSYPGPVSELIPQPHAVSDVGRPLYSCGMKAFYKVADKTDAVPGAYNLFQTGRADYDVSSPAWTMQLATACRAAIAADAHLVFESDLFSYAPLANVLDAFRPHVAAVWCSTEGTSDPQDIGALDQHVDSVRASLDARGWKHIPIWTYIDRSVLAGWWRRPKGKVYVYRCYLPQPYPATVAAARVAIRRMLADAWAVMQPSAAAPVAIAFRCDDSNGTLMNDAIVSAVQDEAWQWVTDHPEVLIAYWFSIARGNGIRPIATEWHRHFFAAIPGKPALPVADPDIDEPPIDPPDDPPPAGGDAMTLIEFFGLGAHYHTAPVNQIYAEVAEALGQVLLDPGDSRKTVGNAGNAAQYIVHGAAYAARALKMVDVQKEIEAAPQEWHDGAAGVLLPSQEKLKNRVLAQMARDNDKLPRAWVDRDPQ